MVYRPLQERIRAVSAEFLATAIFTYIGCGSVTSLTIAPDNSSFLGIALAFGLSITVLAYTLGHHSGGHINPIVTVGMIILRQIDVITGTMYILAQLLGSIVGAGFLRATVSKDAVSSAVNRVSENTDISGAFVMETVLSFLLVFVVAETVVNPKSSAGVNAPIAIGLSVFMAHIVAIPYTGTSINPARSFGPAVVSGEIGGDLWLFFVAPLIGGSIAALVSKYIFGACELPELSLISQRKGGTFESNEGEEDES